MKVALSNRFHKKKYTNYRLRYRYCFVKRSLVGILFCDYSFVESWNLKRPIVL